MRLTQGGWLLLVLLPVMMDALVGMHPPVSKPSRGNKQVKRKAGASDAQASSKQWQRRLKQSFTLIEAVPAGSAQRNTYEAQLLATLGEAFDPALKPEEMRGLAALVDSNRQHMTEEAFCHLCRAKIPALKNCSRGTIQETIDKMAVLCGELSYRHSSAPALPQSDFNHGLALTFGLAADAEELKELREEILSFPALSDEVLAQVCAADIDGFSRQAIPLEEIVRRIKTMKMIMTAAGMKLLDPHSEAAKERTRNNIPALLSDIVFPAAGTESMRFVIESVCKGNEADDETIADTYNHFGYTAEVVANVRKWLALLYVA